MKKEERGNRMETQALGTLVLSMSLPMMASLLIQSLYNIVDSIFVARLSEEALTAASLAYPVQMLMIAAGVGTAVGVNAILSRNLGMKNFDEASRIAQTGLALSGAVSLVFTAAGLAFAGRLAETFTDDPGISSLCAPYLRICMVLCQGNLVCMVFQRLLQASGRAALSMVTLVSGALTNLILDPIMIFGLLGCPAMGIRGAAWATVIGQWVSMLTGLVLNIKMNPNLDLALPGFRMEKERILKIYQVGLPTMIMQAMTSFMVTAFNAILLPFSSAAVRLLQAAELPFHAPERPGTGCHSHRGLQLRGGAPGPGPESRKARLPLGLCHRPGRDRGLPSFRKRPSGPFLRRGSHALPGHPGP